MDNGISYLPLPSTPFAHTPNFVLSGWETCRKSIRRGHVYHMNAYGQDTIM